MTFNDRSEFDCREHRNNNLLSWTAPYDLPEKEQRYTTMDNQQNNYRELQLTSLRFNKCIEGNGVWHIM